jgi:hypothetical protein
MKQTFHCLIRVGMLTVGLVLTAPLYAQMGAGMMGGMGSGMMGGQQGMGGAMPQHGGATNQQKGSEPGAQQMSVIMHDMADQLMQFARQMSNGEVPTATCQRTQEQMWEMAMMIERLSDMAGKDTATHPDVQQQMDEMRQRIQQMRQASDAR